MQHDRVLKNLNLTSTTGSGDGAGVSRQNICYHVATFLDSLQFDMQHGHLLKKLNFDLLTPSLRVVRGFRAKY